MVKSVAERKAEQKEVEKIQYVLKNSPKYFRIKPADLSEISTYHIEIDASSEKQFTGAREDLESKLIDKGLSPVDSASFIFGLAEGIQNAREHGYGFRKGKKIEINFIFTPRYTIASILNIGKKPGLKKIKNNLNQAEKTMYRERGMGYAIITRTSDVVYLAMYKNQVDLHMMKINSGRNTFKPKYQFAKN